MLYDAFICHASEDKEAFVRPLAELLRKHHLEIWYDEFTINIGDGLRRSIDRGLATSSYGIVVVSPAFMKKNWPQRELDGLVAREMAESRQLILPIWHGVSHKDILATSPSLADVKATSSDRGLDAVCRDLLRVLRPTESPLLAARDELLAWGLEPPVVSSEWWLDVVEAASRIPLQGAQVPDRAVWGAWSFPLPNEGQAGALRGVRLAWTAMQLKWTTFAKQNRICQITHPDIVHKFIDGMPGLSEACADFPHILANYSPQLVLPQFSGKFSEMFDSMLERSCVEKSEQRLRDKNFGAALTIDENPPLCDERLALRHETFGNYDAVYVSQFFVRGDMWAPTDSDFDRLDTLIWLVSNASNWLPPKVRTFLIKGLLDSESTLMPPTIADSDWANLTKKLWSSRNVKTFRWTGELKRDWYRIVGSSLAHLELKTSPSLIGDQLIELGIFRRHLEKIQSKRKT